MAETSSDYQPTTTPGVKDGQPKGRHEGDTEAADTNYTPRHSMEHPTVELHTVGDNGQPSTQETPHANQPIINEAPPTAEQPQGEGELEDAPENDHIPVATAQPPIEDAILLGKTEELPTLDGKGGAHKRPGPISKFFSGVANMFRRGPKPDAILKVENKNDISPLTTPNTNAAADPEIKQPVDANR